MDAVLFMEGERREAFRLVRGLKNRYGATDEVRRPAHACGGRHAPHVSACLGGQGAQAEAAKLKLKQSQRGARSSPLSQHAEATWQAWQRERGGDGGRGCAARQATLCVSRLEGALHCRGRAVGRWCAPNMLMCCGGRVYNHRVRSGNWWPTPPFTRVRMSAARSVQGGRVGSDKGLLDGGSRPGRARNRRSAPRGAQVGVFEMTEGGLAAVANPSALFLRDRALAPNASSAVTVAMEGTRPLLLEVQALCSPVHQARPRVRPRASQPPLLQNRCGHGWRPARSRAPRRPPPWLGMRTERSRGSAMLEMTTGTGCGCSHVNGSEPPARARRARRGDAPRAGRRARGRRRACPTASRARGSASSWRCCPSTRACRCTRCAPAAAAPHAAAACAAPLALDAFKYAPACSRPAWAQGRPGVRARLGAGACTCRPGCSQQEACAGQPHSFAPSRA